MLTIDCKEVASIQNELLVYVADKVEAIPTLKNRQFTLSTFDDDAILDVELVISAIKEYFDSIHEGSNFAVISNNNFINITSISGKVIDFSSGEPLVYVSIGVMETTKGTISDEKGNYKLDVAGQTNNLNVRFSMIGYKSQTFTIEELSKNQAVIKLKSEPIQLATITIKPSGKIKEIGTTKFSSGIVCGWGGTDFGKGHEIGLKIELYLWV